MIEASAFVDRAAQAGFEWYAGVPCSFLTPFINYVIAAERLSYVSAANEGDAVAAAAGAYIGGRRAVAMMQNSGLGNAVNPLTSLCHVFQIPMLIICTQRGAAGVRDEPQHQLMGQITAELLTTMRIPWATFPAERAQIDSVIGAVATHFEQTRRPYALIMQKDAVGAVDLNPDSVTMVKRAATIAGDGLTRTRVTRPTRAAVLTRVLERTTAQSAVVIATTGYTGRELYTLADRPNHFYMVGSMGCAPALGLGLAMTRPEQQIVVLDGDGAALMRLGNFATVGTYGGDNFCHIVLDNEVHDSTGAQFTVSSNVDFARVAQACGYAQVWQGDDVDLVDACLRSPTSRGPRLLHIKIKPGTMPNLPRPTVTPPEVLQRLTEHLGTRS